MSYLPKGASSKKFVVGGKPTGQTKYGLMGKNTYSDVFMSPIASRVEFDGNSPENERAPMASMMDHTHPSTMK